VARLMMMGIHFMKAVPFNDVYVHALVRNAQGMKMSKSKGNVIDPLVMMDQFGTDALRFTLTAFAVQGRDVKLSEERIEGYKHFVNKIWNAARLVLMNLEGRDEVDEGMENYHFNQVANSLYQFLWHEYCDWYLEMVKPDFYGKDPEAKSLAQSVAVTVLTRILVLLHPIMPFVTEEIWQKLPHQGDSIMNASLPRIESWRQDPEAEEQMGLVMGVINGIRNIRGEMNVSPGTGVEVTCFCDGSPERELLSQHGGLIRDLAKVSRLLIAEAAEPARPRIAAKTVVGKVEVYVLLKGVVDFASESKRIEKELAKLEKEFSITQKKLSNEDYLQKAPPEVIEKEREKGARLGEKIDKLRHHHERISSLRENTAGEE